jgi:hypothetical protein
VKGLVEILYRDSLRSESPLSLLRPLSPLTALRPLMALRPLSPLRAALLDSWPETMILRAIFVVVIMVMRLPDPNDRRH